MHSILHYLHFSDILETFLMFNTSLFKVAHLTQMHLVR